MSRFEEQFGIFLIPEPHRPVFPRTPHVAPDIWWEHSVRTDLQTINKTKVGRALLCSIKWHGVTVSIQPDRPGTSTLGGNHPIEDDLRAGNPQLQISMGPMIEYSPERSVPDHHLQQKFKVFGQLQIDGHEVLLHELVHAFRMASFKFDRKRAGKGFSFYNNNEEIYAILVQGIYASERGRGIRGAHLGHFSIDKQLEGSFDYFKTGTEAFEHVKKFCTENPGLTKAIAQVRTGFNPIRAYYCDPARAQRTSRSRLARERDLSQPILRSGFNFLKDALEQAGLI